MDQTIISGIRSGEVWVFAVCPIEIAAVDDQSTDAVAMTANIFRGGMDHNVCAVVEGTKQIWRGKCIIDNQRNSIFFRNAGNRFDIDNVYARIPDCFDENSPRKVVDRFAKILRIIRIDKSAS